MQVSVWSSVCPSINIYPGCLVSAIPLTVLYWSFWNFACVFFMVWGCAYGLNTICKSFFTLSMHTVGTSCKRNSSCRFLPIVLKLCLCFLHGMKMSMWFGYNSRIIFCHLFHIVNLVIFHPLYISCGYLVSTTPHTILYQSFLNFAHAFSIVWRCACEFDIILQAIFYFFSLFRFCDCNSSYNCIPIFLKLCTCFLQGLQMCIWVG